MGVIQIPEIADCSELAKYLKLIDANVSGNSRNNLCGSKINHCSPTRLHNVRMTIKYPCSSRTIATLAKWSGGLSENTSPKWINLIGSLKSFTYGSPLANIATTCLKLQWKHSICIISNNPGKTSIGNMNIARHADSSTNSALNCSISEMGLCQHEPSLRRLAS